MQSVLIPIVKTASFCFNIKKVINFNFTKSKKKKMPTVAPVKLCTRTKHFLLTVYMRVQGFSKLEAIKISLSNNWTENSKERYNLEDGGRGV